jgi:hypothetical protein
MKRPPPRLARRILGRQPSDRRVGADRASSFDLGSRWTAVAGVVIQFLMLALLFCGYVFTVLPVYQKERLAEQVAGLEIEKAKATQDLEALRRSSVLNADLVQRQKEALHALTESAEEQSRKARAAEEMATQATTTALHAQQRLSQSMEQQAAFQWKLLQMQSIVSLFAETENDATNSQLWPDNLKASRAVVSHLRKDKRVGIDFTPAMIDKFSSFLESHHTDLGCARPDVDAWAAQRDKAIQAGDRFGAALSFDEKVRQARDACVQRAYVVFDQFFDAVKAP